MKTLKQKLTAELIRTMFLVIVAIASTILPMTIGVDMGVTVFVNAVAVAFVLFALIEAFAPISGAHFNPAVTLALSQTGEMRKATLHLYRRPVRRGLPWTDHRAPDVLGHQPGPDLHLEQRHDRQSVLRRDRGHLHPGGNKCGSASGGRVEATGMAVAFLVGGMLVSTVSTMFANQR